MVTGDCVDCGRPGRSRLVAENLGERVFMMLMADKTLRTRVERLATRCGVDRVVLRAEVLQYAKQLVECEQSGH